MFHDLEHFWSTGQMYSQRAWKVIFLQTLWVGNGKWWDLKISWKILQKFLHAQENVGKRENLWPGARDGECWLHRSPKCSWTSDSCLSCFFTSATTRVCQNMRYRLQYSFRKTYNPLKKMSHYQKFLSEAVFDHLEKIGKLYFSLIFNFHENLFYERYDNASTLHLQGFSHFKSFL